MNKYLTILDRADIEVGERTLILHNPKQIPIFSAYHHGRLVGVCHSYATTVQILDDYRECEAQA